MATLAAGESKAAVTMPPVFSDHMVLQKSAHVPVWGWAAPGEKVRVSMKDQSAEATADKDGKWQVVLDLSRSGPGPFQMTVQGSDQVVINDVLVGEVWLASGQSNMGFPLGATTGADKEVAGSANNSLRMFMVDMIPSSTPADKVKGQWFVAGPATSGKFSAVGYYFGKKVQNDLGVPVGVVNSSFGGTFIESWMSQRVIDADPDLQALQKGDAEYAASYPAALKLYGERFREWQKNNNREDYPQGKPEDFAPLSVSVKDWLRIKLPAGFVNNGLPDAGVTWLRKELRIPASVVGQPLRVDLGNIRDFDTVYWNGVKIAEVTCDSSPGEQTKWTCTVPGNLVTEGPAVLAVRVFTPTGGATAGSHGSGFRVIRGWFVEFLEGDWLAKAEYAMPTMTESARKSLPAEPEAPMKPQNIPAWLFNGMINSLIPYGIRGVIWYQGESNEAFAVQYRERFLTLIRDWRAWWRQDDLPFYFCQIASFGDRMPTPGESQSAELREAQTLTTSLSKTGEAILIDIGEEKDLHPRNKKEAGERLALVALADTYGKDIPHSGPVYKSQKIEGNTIRVTFANTDDGLVARQLPAMYQPRTIKPDTVPLVRNSPQSEVEGFAICGSDHKWVWANARIDGDSIVVSSPSVTDPVAVRYAWAEDPICNLYNGAGLPAGPFRTDDFPGITKKRTN